MARKKLISAPSFFSQSGSRLLGYSRRKVAPLKLPLQSLPSHNERRVESEGLTEGRWSQGGEDGEGQASARSYKSIDTSRQSSSKGGVAAASFTTSLLSLSMGSVASNLGRFFRSVSPNASKPQPQLVQRVSPSVPLQSSGTSAATSSTPPDTPRRQSRIETPVLSERSSAAATTGLGLTAIAKDGTSPFPPVAASSALESASISKLASAEESSSYSHSMQSSHANSLPQSSSSSSSASSSASPPLIPPATHVESEGSKPPPSTSEGIPERGGAIRSNSKRASKAK